MIKRSFLKSIGKYLHTKVGMTLPLIQVINFSQGDSPFKKKDRNCIYFRKTFEQNECFVTLCSIRTRTQFIVYLSLLPFSFTRSKQNKTSSQ